MQYSKYSETISETTNDRRHGGSGSRGSPGNGPGPPSEGNRMCLCTGVGAVELLILMDVDMCLLQHSLNSVWCVCKVCVSGVYACEVCTMRYVVKVM